MISAIVLAAGQSFRMGQPKMMLPWGKTTVIGKVTATLLEAGLDDLHLVVGGNQKELNEALRRFQVQFVFNPDFANGEMISSVQVGIRSLLGNSEAALIVLGDQPQLEVSVVQTIIEIYITNRSKIIVPSYQMHRGHPCLIDKSLWGQLLDLKPPHTLRDYLNQYQDDILYVNVDTPSVIQDLDTPDDYKKFYP
ncbi:MAG: hypothetical protein A2Y53_09055 [Chloroflexi bacterium RBG_16_47_49]|nr:MAG: hypothetical protein A2Y53_09055 [Chloroflexi bacterium RBG_16_47_49]